jgi:molecular chaperone GrpE (heat shock protein)
MTALSQEVRLQGRSFKQLHETILQSTQPSQTEERQPRKQEIEVLIDLRDRIERGGSTARTAVQELALARLPVLARWLDVGRGYARQTQEILSALAQGYSLTLDTLDEALLACRVSRIAAEGQLFDPRCMTAIDIEVTAAVPEGTVVAVYRNGYEWKNEIYRTAQVKVARNPEKKLS